MAHPGQPLQFESGAGGTRLLSAIGIAMACAIVLLGRTSGDAIDLILDVQFDRAHREDVQVMFV
ncbi:MAG: hypothetical protein AAFR95_10860, partial [Bacteroidota bacterium]